MARFDSGEMRTYAGLNFQYQLSRILIIVTQSDEGKRQRVVSPIQVIDASRRRLEAFHDA